MHLSNTSIERTLRHRENSIRVLLCFATKVQPENKILKIRLERGHKKNALTEKMYLELGNLIDNSSKDPDVNVILIFGLHLFP